MKTLIYILISIALLGLLVIWLLSNKKEAESKVYHYDKDEAILITTDTVTLRNLSAEFSYTGTFEPFREGKVMAESQGKIAEMHAELGDFLVKEELLQNLMMNC
jgi:membrane fusion protein, multidrug efflux system